MPGRHVARRKRRQTEDDEYAAMLLRMIQNYAARIGRNPDAAVHLPELKATLAAAGNLGFYVANRQGDRPYSLNELARLAGVSKQSMHEQIKRGEVTAGQLAEAMERGEPRVRIADLRAARI